MTDCVFCDPEKIKSRTITSLDGVNIVATLGQITEGGYVLLIPTSHSPCLGAFGRRQIKSFEKIVGRVVLILETEYQNQVTIFEHGIVGQTIEHSHLHILPVMLDLTERVASDFPESKMQIVENLTQLQSLYHLRLEPYLLWSTFDKKYMVCWNPPAPAQYFRTLSAQLLGVPERADWKKMDPQKDKSLREETMKRFTPYFTSNISS